MKEITSEELKKMKESGEDFQLIDVREPYEVEIESIGGINIPMGNIMDRLDEVAKDKKVVLHCQAGRRSAAVINSLEQRFNYSNLYNLRGGILEYLKSGA
jgi:adenylyltransferase/sulfurtransferase